MPQPSAATRVRLVNSMLQSARSYLSGLGAIEVLIPLILQGPSPATPSISIKCGSLTGWLTQSGEATLAACIQDLGAAYSIAPRFRPDYPGSPNHLIQFHLVQALIPGDYRMAISTALDLINHMTASSCVKVTVNLCDIDMAAPPLPNEFISRQYDIPDFDYERQMKEIDDNNGASIVLTDNHIDSMSTHVNFRREGAATFLLTY